MIIKMEKTNWTITQNYWDYQVENMLFTYNENEIQENRFNKFVVEQERKWWSYFVIEQQQLALWFSEAEAIMFNFIDWYTKSWKYFWYSTQDICEKTYWWKDKVINTIKSLVKKWYVIKEKWKDRFWNERRFLSTTTKYSLELLKLRGVSENQIGGIWKSDRGVSEKPTHSIIYSNINSNKINNENQNQEQSQEQINSLPKQITNITPLEKSGDLTFTEIYNNFYRKSWHKQDMKAFEKAYNSMWFTQEQLKDILIDENIFKIEYKYGVKDIQYRPKFDTYITSLNLDNLQWNNRLYAIAKYHYDNMDDVEKTQKRNADIQNILWDKLYAEFKKLAREYSKKKHTIKMWF